MEPMSSTGNALRFLVVEDSPVFAALAANTIRMSYQGARVDECHSYEDAAGALLSHDFDVVVCGYGIGDGHTVFDMRSISDAPIVLLTGRPDQLTVPQDVRIVEKSAGPAALLGAISGCLAPVG